MAVDKVNVVDAIGLDRNTDEVVLTVADQFPWDLEEHLALLQAKLNRYLGFIEHGELLQNYPASAGRSVRIDIVCRFHPSAEAEAFLKRAALAIRNGGLTLSWWTHDA